MAERAPGRKVRVVVRGAMDCARGRSDRLPLDHGRLVSLNDTMGRPVNE
jgi:hypothetical protein